jgi:hypothetical protein
MKIIVIILLLSSCLGCQQNTDRYEIIIEDITIIDVENAELVPNQTIYIRHDRIEKITSSNGSDGILSDTIINGAGKYILPGFWDMHVHACWKDDLDKNVFPVFLQYGITGIRDMGGSLEILNSFKNKAKNQPYLYPNLYGAGPLLDGERPVHPAFSISVTTENFRKVLDSLRNNQVDFFKVYSLLPSIVLDSIATYSSQHKINFSGHISEYITPEKASKLGYKSFEHLNRLEELSDDSTSLNELIGMLKENGNWLCPTMVMYQRKNQMVKGDFFYHSLFEGLDKDLKMEWENLKNKSATKSENEIIISNNRFRKQKNLVKTFYDNQIPLLIGTDFAGMQFIYPGYSYHEEMMLMQELGITQFEILKMATLNPAIYLNISESFGTVEKNKTADLVILNANPIENIENTLSIEMVIKSGVIVKK